MSPIEIPDHVSTLEDLILWGGRLLEKSDLFYGHGTDNALDEAAWLAAHALGLSFDSLEQQAGRVLSQQEKQSLTELFRKRIETRLPAAYLTREAWFCGLPFYVDERVLIPRSPIAELIEGRFEPWLDSTKVTAILDLCAGSGCIGLACAYAFEQAHVDLAELSDDALAVSTINVQRHELNDRVRAVSSDVYTGVAGRKYDLIVSNPPYVSNAEMATLPTEYNHEPALALAAGDDGLLIVRQILDHAAEHLNPEGILIVEVGNSEQAVVEAFPHVPFVWLEFEYGGQGVFLLTAQDCLQYF